MKLRFDNGPLLAASLSFLLLLWMGSGVVGGDSRAGAEPAPVSGRTLERGAVRVLVQTVQAQTIDQLVTLHGVTAPDRAVTLRAETAGRVLSLQAGEGDRVAAGALLAALEPGDLPARLAHARDLVTQRELEYTGTQRLRKQNNVSEAELAAARARLSSARAELRAIERSQEKTRVDAPFAGSVDRLLVETGDYVQAGDPVARILNFRPTLVIGHVSETEGALLSDGLAGAGALRDGTVLSGHVRHVAAEADSQSRTHRVEFELASVADWQPLAGSTARIDIRVRSVTAHLLSPALLTLDETGRLGVKVVDPDERARFMPVQLVRAGVEGAWVSGLPERTRLITMGAGFVDDGETVEAVTEEAAGEPATI